LKLQIDHHNAADVICLGHFLSFR